MTSSRKPWSEESSCPIVHYYLEDKSTKSKGEEKYLILEDSENSVGKQDHFNKPKYRKTAFICAHCGCTCKNRRSRIEREVLLKKVNRTLSELRNLLEQFPESRQY